MIHVLLVEDNDLNRDMLARRLTRRGFRVSTALNGVEAVEAALEHRPDIILMDMSLPLVDGYDATKRIRTDAAGARIPILGLSAHAMGGDASRARDAGCDDYDVKPVVFKRLLSKMESLLAQRSSTSAARVDREDDRRWGASVLLVDLHGSAAEDLLIALGSAGFKVTHTRDHASVLTQLSGNEFDAIVIKGASVTARLEALLRLVLTELAGAIPLLLVTSSQAAAEVAQRFKLPQHQVLAGASQDAITLRLQALVAPAEKAR